MGPPKPYRMEDKREGKTQKNTVACEWAHLLALNLYSTLSSSFPQCYGEKYFTNIFSTLQWPYHNRILNTAY